MTIEKFDDLSKFVLQEEEGIVNINDRKIAFISDKIDIIKETSGM